MVAAVLWTVSVVLDVFVFQPLRGWLGVKIAFYFLNAHLQLQLAAEALEGLLFVRMWLCVEYGVQLYEI